jgi:hypothetical protein
MLKRLFPSALLLLSATAANATILIDLQSGSPTSDGAGGFNWNYNVSLEPGAFITAGDSVALYDVPGLRGASFAKDAGVPGTGSFSTTTPATGPKPGFFNPTDTAAPNAVLTFDGPGNITAPGGTSGPSLLLGTLTVDSDFGGAGAALGYGSLTHKVGGSQGPLFAVSSVAGPVPEPSAYGFMAAGLAAVGTLALRRNRRNKK